ncbi:putative gustatory receptor 2a [Schistocerca gregaria]|uniref:putative gustatory receptor 2a n=1 Tax=Schistocerca gregaria TaxID=7010 RepID=UPI00211E7FD6|nr:putative gustatory receptor 2a [Schistocerca gregaria]
MGRLNSQLLKSVRPPLHGEADLEEAVTSGRQWWATEGKLRRLQRARLALHRVARLCGQHFGPALLLSVLNTLIQIVYLSYALVLRVKYWPWLENYGHSDVLVLSALLFYTTSYLLAICWICSSAVDRAGTARKLLEMIRILSPSVTNSICLRLSVESMRFSAIGFFDIDLHLFVAVLGATVTYLIILVQFYS